MDREDWPVTWQQRLRRAGTLVVFFIIFLGSAISGTKNDFKVRQLRFPRVRQAYKEKEVSVKAKLSQKNIKSLANQLFLRAFKYERILEVWVKELGKSGYIHLLDYTFCASCGSLGPKRKQGDMQIPEGFYYIDRFNAWSNFYLSLGLNYPNRSDKILSPYPNPGGDIFIHGNCVTIGCIPITDDKIKELYILAVEARTTGQRKIPVHIFPVKMNPVNLSKLFGQYKQRPDLIKFWKGLQPVFDYFEKTRKIPEISIDNKGKYLLK